MFKEMFSYVVVVLGWLAIPVAIYCLYDKFVAEPKRSKDEDGEPAPPPAPAEWAYTLLPWTLIAAVLSIGVQRFLTSIEVFVTPLSLLALPLAAYAAYDKWVLAPKRPRRRDGKPTQAPWYVGLVHWLLVIAVFALVYRIGAPFVFGKAKSFAEPLSVLAIPVGLWCFIDSWFLAPRRHIIAGTAQPPEPPALTRIAYAVLPLLLVAVITRMITAETLDFSLVLFLLSLGTGLVWAIDHFFFRKRREAAAKAVQPQPIQVAEPGAVDYARSFFPVALIVLVVRAFIFEPFRIPSDSMMPTLLDGDFIVVNKYAYGLRWPVLNTKIVEFDSPQRGDVVVFRYPPDPKVNFIKRLVGLPGDRVQVIDDHLIINGETIPLQDAGRFTDGCYIDLRLSTETIGNHTHKVMSCRTPGGLIHTKPQGIPSAPGWPSCDRKALSDKDGHLYCREIPQGRDGGDFSDVFQGAESLVVPAGFYVAIGDNRDNSSDSRVWGLVPEQNLVGKATRIWFNFDLQRSSWVDWSRIGQGIE